MILHISFCFYDSHENLYTKPVHHTVPFHFLPFSSSSLSGALVVLLLVCYASPSMGQRIWHRNIIFLIIFSILLLAIINSSRSMTTTCSIMSDHLDEAARQTCYHIYPSRKKSEVAYATYVWCVNHLISSKEEIYKFATTVIQYIFSPIWPIKVLLQDECKKNM